MTSAKDQHTMCDGWKYSQNITRSKLLVPFIPNEISVHLWKQHTRSIGKIITPPKWAKSAYIIHAWRDEQIQYIKKERKPWSFTNFSQTTTQLQSLRHVTHIASQTGVPPCDYRAISQDRCEGPAGCSQLLHIHQLILDVIAVTWEIGSVLIELAWNSLGWSLSDILPDFLTYILRIYLTSYLTASEILFGMFWLSILHSIRQSFWRMLWQFLWRSIMRSGISWHIVWLSIRHSIWQIFLCGQKAWLGLWCAQPNNRAMRSQWNILTFYLTFYRAFWQFTWRSVQDPESWRTRDGGTVRPSPGQGETTGETFCSELAQLCGW